MLEIVNTNTRAAAITNHDKPLSYARFVEMLDKAEMYSQEGPGTRVGPRVYVFPAIELEFFADRALVARVQGTDLWVESRDVEGITTLDGLKELGKPLPELLETYLKENNVYQFNVFEVGDEDPEWPDYSRNIERIR